jgi:hypothetical protein
MNWLERLKHARRVSVPLVAINTPDAASTIRAVTKAFGGNGDPVPVVCWDVCSGVRAVNRAGQEVAQSTGDGEDDTTIGQPSMFLMAARKFPEATIAFLLNAHAYWDQSPAVPQGVWNLRDDYKADGRMLILLSQDVQLPAQLKDDVVVLDEPLPDDDALGVIVQECDESRDTGRMDDPTRSKAVEAIRGLSSFSAEQAVAMALRKEGIDLDHLWEAKRKQVEVTPGLSVFRNECKFCDLGGLQQLKEYVKLIMSGRNAPSIIVWLDEIATSGVGARSDLSGINQSMEGHLLQWMQDRRVFGVMLAGVQGAGKSEFCKAIGGEFSKPVIRLDLDATKGGLVGQSESNLRRATKVIDACSGGVSGSVLWIATANSLDNLSGPMKNRFVDTFFFDLPNRKERLAIWKVWLKKLQLRYEPYEDDDGWNGRNIWQCCDKAWRMRRKIAEVARWITPVGTTDREVINKLRVKADGRYLSVCKDGLYKTDEGRTKKVGRRVAL